MSHDRLNIEKVQSKASVGPLVIRKVLYCQLNLGADASRGAPGMSGAATTTPCERRKERCGGVSSSSYHWKLLDAADHAEGCLLWTAVGIPGEPQGSWDGGFKVPCSAASGICGHSEA